MRASHRAESVFQSALEGCWDAPLPGPMQRRWPPAKGLGRVQGGVPLAAPSCVDCPRQATPLCRRAAWIDKCRPNLLITESTYATTIRDSKRCRERDFLKKVHETVERGGKVGPWQGRGRSAQHWEESSL